MFTRIKNNFFAFTSAIVVHLLFVVIIMLGIDWSGKPKSITDPEQNIVQAVAVDEKQVQAELKKLKDAEKQRQLQEKRKQTKAEQELRKAQEARKKEEQRLANIKKEKERTRIANEKEKDRLAELALQREKEQLRIDQEKDRLERIKKEKEKAEKERIEEENRLAEMKLQQQLEDEAREDKERENARIAAQKEKDKRLASKKFQSELIRYKQLITDSVSQNWLKPAKFEKGASCNVRVKLLPGGDVVDVKVDCSQENDVFIRSVIAAVNRASPLPVSDDPDVFNEMRDLVFKFAP